MNSNKQLFVICNSKFRLRHLLVIAILGIAFSVTFMIRSQGAEYGFVLNEFDPYFNFRATQFLVDNGFEEYFNWHDERSWNSIGGRNVSATSQAMLHITAATLYQIFGFGSSLNDFTIIFPLVFGSLTTLVIFALVRVIGGTTAGLFAAMLFSISVPLITRGMIGWFKSEPLGLFYGLLAMYLFLSGIKSKNKKTSLLKLVFGGIFFSFALSSWGGIQFLTIPLGLFFIAIPFFRKDHSFLIWAIPVFSSSLILSSLMFERPGFEGFVTALGGFAIIGPTIFMVITMLIQKISNDKHKLRHGLVFLIASIVLGSSLLIINPLDEENSRYLIHLPSFRYLNAINPFLTTTDPLTDSVAEHASLTIENAFRFSSTLMIFAGIGIWLLLRKNEKTNSFLDNDMIVFSLIFGIMGVYIASSFVRLELFASISMIIFASLGLAILSRGIFSKNYSSEQNKRTKKIKKILISSPNKLSQVAFIAIITGLLVIPLTLPSEQTWIDVSQAPATILNGGTHFLISTSDWPDAMVWLKNNTPEDSVVIAWWDYGYWITTLADRITIADNATLSTTVIQNIAKMLTSTPDDAWTMLNDMNGDYLLIYVAATKLPDENDIPLYLLGGGGDESKKQWFIRIAEEPLEKYVMSDYMTGTNYFWENTILGKTIPFKPVVYYDDFNNRQTTVYQHGLIPIYQKINSYPSDGDGPLRLVYESDSLKRTTTGVISGVLIYEINKEYKPLN